MGKRVCPRPVRKYQLLQRDFCTSECSTMHRQKSSTSRTSQICETVQNFCHPTVPSVNRAPPLYTKTRRAPLCTKTSLRVSRISTSNVSPGTTLPLRAAQQTSSVLQIHHLFHFCAVCEPQALPRPRPAQPTNQRATTHPSRIPAHAAIAPGIMTGRTRRASTSSVDTVDERTIHWRQEASVLRSVPKTEPNDDWPIFQLRDAIVLNRDGTTVENALHLVPNGPFIVRGNLHYNRDEKRLGTAFRSPSIDHLARPPSANLRCS